MAAEPRVSGGTRRPDGTVRKEIKIRPGYVPQDEQPVYQTGGTLRKQGVPRCPGFDPDAASTTPTGGAKSKAAKKNEKRKAKKTEEAGPPGQTPPSQPQASTAAPSSSKETSSSSSRAAPSAAAAAAASSPASNDPAAVLDRQIKALSKKVRQCISLAERKQAGDVLSPQELEKVAKMPGWQEEINELEHQLAKMMS